MLKTLRPGFPVWKMRRLSIKTVKRYLPLLLAAPAAVLLLSPAAQALTTYKLNYTTAQGVGSLQGTLTIDEKDPLAANFAFNPPILIPFLKSLSLQYYDGSFVSNYILANYGFFAWVPKSPGAVNFVADLVPQFSTLNVYSASGGAPYACGNLSLCAGGNTYILSSAVPVPAPLPLFGAAAAFHTSRRLRRRLKSRACAAA